MKNYKNILLISIPSLILIDILIRIWFRFSLQFDSTVFNNIVTPIGGILSTILFFYALRLTIQQNQIILSQSLKPYFDEKFNRIKSDFEQTGNLPIYEPRGGVKSKNMVSEIWAVYRIMIQNDDYKRDVVAYQNGSKFKVVDFINKSYSKEAVFLTQFTIQPLWELQSVADYLIEINESNLVIEDKTYLKRRVRETLIDEYYNLIDKNHFDNNMFFFPKYDGRPQDEVEFVHLLRDKNFKKYYEFFKKEL